MIDRDKLLALESATGKLITEFRLPPIDGIEIMEFGHIMVSGDYLVATIDPQIFDDGEIGRENWNATSSNILVVLNRHDGNLIWTKKAEMGFRHNAITAGNGRLYLVDGLSDGAIDLLKRRGHEPEMTMSVIAVNIGSGETIWEKKEGVFGTWLGYYEDKDILIQAGRHGGLVNLDDEPRNPMIAHCGETGEVLWEYNNDYNGPLGLHPDMIIMSPNTRTLGGQAIEPLTGNIFQTEHPITGTKYDWSYQRYYGCGLINASRHLITFRSGTAGYADLLNFGGTGNFGGFRSGCTNNLVVADGILNAADYTRTCTCAYPLQTSVGLVHMPDAGVEMWTLNRLERGEATIQSLGINFGAQGNRWEDGVLWLEYPKVYAAGPDLPIKIESSSLEWFRHHATWIEKRDEQYDWVASYGVKGITSISVDLVPEGSQDEKSYTVALYFAEPEELSAGDRVFDVSLQGEKVLENFDIVRESGGSKRVLKKMFHGVKVDNILNIGFSNIINSAVISGVEIVSDGQPASFSESY